jgi:hypothetical protein
MSGPPSVWAYAFSSGLGSFTPFLATPRLTDFLPNSTKSGNRLRMHALLRAIGVLALIAGLGFMGQGFRFFAYPADSFMIGHTRWVYYGAGIAVAGLLLIIFSRPSDEP